MAARTHSSLPWTQVSVAAICLALGTLGATGCRSDQDRFDHHMRRANEALEIAGGEETAIIELLSAMRSLVRRGCLPESDAQMALDFLWAVPIRRHDVRLLRHRIWELRDNLSACDAAYLALAEALGAPLVTCDNRLARAPGHAAVVDLVAAD